MTTSLSPHDFTTTNMSAHTSSTTHARRTSRGSSTPSSCRPSRIEKPRSNHNSPRIRERRKTTTETKLYATLDDHYNLMFGITNPEEAIEDQSSAHRPMSWHPSSTQFQVPSRSSVTQPQDWPHHQSTSSRHSTHGSDFYSLSARNSTYSEMPYNSNYTNSHNMHRGSQDSNNSWQDGSQQASTYALSAYSTPTVEPMPWYLQAWAQRNQEHAAMKAQNNDSTDFLPIQYPSTTEKEPSEADEDMEDTGNELVGMGLYDLPEPSLSWNFGLIEATGKGLKLEETWQPPEDDDDDNEEEEEEAEEEDADDASSDASVEDLSPPLPPANEQAPQLHMPVSKVPGDMGGQSFFFDEDETVSREWWFQQLKQPSMPVRDAGIGYGWL